jgi:hypothetical protein
MKLPSVAALVSLALVPESGDAAASISYPPIEQFRLSGVSLVETSYQGDRALRVTMPSSAYQDASKDRLLDRDFMAWLPVDFHNGTLELDVASDLAPDAPAYARGFIGVSFRIDDMSRFESIYLRPTNSQANDQVRRNHSVQYAAYPDFPFDQLRASSPEKYETYAELQLGRWTHMKIEVRDATATLFLDHNEKPALIVNDLKLGPSQRGGVGLWIESGTVAHFKDIRITP